MTSQRRPDELIRILRTDFAGSPGSPGGGGGAANYPIHVPVTAVHNTTDLLDEYVVYDGARMLDNKWYDIYGWFRCPAALNVTVQTIIFLAGTAGNRVMRARTNVIHYVLSTSGNILASSTTAGFSNVTVPGVAIPGANYVYLVNQTVTVAGMGAGNVARIRFERDGAHANDTIGADVWGWGWNVSYA